ncbi:MAG: hypothetical protein ACYC56_12300 [Candidatus Aquicultor sp.]
MTRLNDTMSLQSEIEQDVTAARELLKEHAFSGHQLLNDQARDIEDLPLATLLFVTASLGTYRPEELRPVAVGLELLRFAAEKHYLEMTDLDTAGNLRNLFLVTADFYYAQAITIAATVQKGFVVEHMVHAIAEIAGAEAARQKHDKPVTVSDENASLFHTAVKLGMLLGGCSSEFSDALTNFASCFGRICQAQNESDADIAALKNRALIDSNVLPLAQRSFLENLFL